MMEDYTYYRGLRGKQRHIDSESKATPGVIQLRPAKPNFKRNAKEALWLEPISNLAAVGPSTDF